VTTPVAKLQLLFSANTLQFLVVCFVAFPLDHDIDAAPYGYCTQIARNSLLANTGSYIRKHV
jgi:hypothetical protein